MRTNTVADMTLEELKALIDRQIQQAITEQQQKPDAKAVNASIREHRIVPPPGAKSATEMLREDRDV
ncbi:MAG: hypothetical protein AAFV33_28300 [Chloroflexota bacterium]